MAEKRKYPRINKNINISYQTYYEKSDFSFGKAASNDISLGGVQFETEDIDTVGTKLLLKFQIQENQKTIETKGIVRWVKRINPYKYQIGIEFTEIKQEDYPILIRLCLHKRAITF